MKIWSKTVSGLKSLSPTEYLLVGFGLWAVLLIGTWLYDWLTTPLQLQDAASHFAVDLRAVQAMADQRHEFLRLHISPMSDRHPARYDVLSGSQVLSSKEMPAGISLAGAVNFDPQGVPAVPATFILSKRRHHLKVTVDTQGLITVIPES